MSMVETEQVMVVPTELFHDCGHFQGFQADCNHYLEKLLDPIHTQYRPRDLMEKDPSFKQLIPYCIFQHRDADGELQIFQYTRGKGQGESRLHSKRSIGVGGHISTVDISDHSPYEVGMQRELDEEVLIETAFEQELVGMINDDHNDVGKVHLGIVHLFTVEKPSVWAREKEIIESGFTPTSQLLSNMDRFETWSQICLKAIFGSE